MLSDTRAARCRSNMLSASQGACRRSPARSGNRALRHLLCSGMFRCTRVAPRARRTGFAAHVRGEAADLSDDGDYQPASGIETDADVELGSGLIRASSEPTIAPPPPPDYGGREVKAKFGSEKGVGTLVWQLEEGNNTHPDGEPITVVLGTKMVTVEFKDGSKKDVDSDKKGTLGEWLKFINHPDIKKRQVEDGDPIAIVNP
ncbi:unnamed protein product [Ostreobium quekettii]|uniref:Uncharacterized protein n=1 Tax=Ostreobium quekettii TaxID=121088 RepID=A0A8S1IV50_9CHLO|nr:unnamed protein product [Ostreobium quekettii]